MTLNIAMRAGAGLLAGHVRKCLTRGGEIGLNHATEPTRPDLVLGECESREDLHPPQSALRIDVEHVGERDDNGLN
jgi:hypothetical protein